MYKKTKQNKPLKCLHSGVSVSLFSFPSRAGAYLVIRFNVVFAGEEVPRKMGTCPWCFHGCRAALCTVVVHSLYPYLRTYGYLAVCMLASTEPITAFLSQGKSSFHDHYGYQICYSFSLEDILLELLAFPSIFRPSVSSRKELYPG